MGVFHSSYLDAKQRKYLAGRTVAVLKNFIPHYQRQSAAAYLEHVRNEVEQRGGEPTQLLYSQDAVPPGEVLREGTLLLFQDHKWKERHLQVTRDLTVECYGSKEARSTLLLSACQICTSPQQLHLLLEESCHYTTGGGELPLCPSEFPVFLLHPYCAPVCVCARSREDQRGWHRVLGSAVRHHSSALQRRHSYEAKALLEAVRFYRQEKGSYGSGVLTLGSEEEVLSNLVMEDLLPWLRTQVFPQLRVSQGRRSSTWIQLVWEVHSRVSQQVSVELRVLKEQDTLQLPLLVGRIRPNLDQIVELQEDIAGRLADHMSAVIERGVTRSVSPSLLLVLQKLAPPLRSGFIGIRQLFTDACDDIIRTGRCGQSAQELAAPLSQLSSGQSFELLELLAERLGVLREWLGVEGAPLITLRAQNTLQQLLDSAVYTFRSLLCQQLSESRSPSQLSRTLHRVRGRVAKKLDHDCRLAETRLFQEALLLIAQPVLLRELEPSCKLGLAQYEEMVFADYSTVIHIENIYEDVVVQALMKEINEVLTCIPDSTDQLDNQLTTAWRGSSNHLSDSSTGSYDNIPKTLGEDPGEQKSCDQAEEASQKTCTGSTSVLKTERPTSQHGSDRLISDPDSENARVFLKTDQNNATGSSSHIEDQPTRLHAGDLQCLEFTSIVDARELFYKPQQALGGNRTDTPELPIKESRRVAMEEGGTSETMEDGGEHQNFEESRLKGQEPSGDAFKLGPSLCLEDEESLGMVEKVHQVPMEIRDDQPPELMNHGFDLQNGGGGPSLDPESRDHVVFGKQHQGGQAELENQLDNGLAMETAENSGKTIEATRPKGTEKEGAGSFGYGGVWDRTESPKWV
ncbi:protein Niban 1-like isoform X1 [Acipenser ruthenus]|uniref:protein Niban 1-like isoform X1 n=1 Tax=Acipenser ruthenus TaxID=7906 RepID=UPI0027410055|nr:protein Niban 1-like isoform X1 [Acipenser ruthenus]